MPALTWDTIADNEVDGKSPVTEALLGKFFNNQEVLGNQAVDCRFVEGTHNGATYTTVATAEVFVPECGASTDGNFELKVRIQVKVDSGDTGQIQIRLGSGTWVESSTFTNAAYGTSIELTISAADVRTYSGTLEDITVQAKIAIGSTGPVYAQNELGASRLERAA